MSVIESFLMGFETIAYFFTFESLKAISKQLYMYMFGLLCMQAGRLESGPR